MLEIPNYRCLAPSRYRFGIR